MDKQLRHRRRTSSQARNGIAVSASRACRRRTGACWPSANSAFVFFSAAELIWSLTQSRVVPYVVQVDRVGAAQTIAPADVHYQPTDPQIAYFLAHFIADVRALSIDPVVVRENWLQAYDFATDHGAVFLNDYAQANDPFKHVGDRTVSVQVTSVVRVSDNSFQVKWIEQTYDHDALARTEHWTAILSVVTKAPANADVLRKNPLGLYVNGINWSRELSPNENP